MGGEAALPDAVVKCAAEGGESLLAKLVGLTKTFGPRVIKALGQSPKVMVEAFEKLAPELKEPALRAAYDDPALITKLVTQFGERGLEIAARHPGVAEQVATNLGADGLAVANGLTRDQAILLSRHSEEISRLSSGQKTQVLQKISRAPQAMLDFLEAHPKTLLTTAAVATFLASKDNILGAPGIDKPGLIERISFPLLDLVSPWIKALFAILLAGIGTYVVIHIRGAWRMHRLREQAIIAETYSKQPIQDRLD